MAYKIYAKRGKKTMPIKLESKHYYDNLNYIYINLYKSNVSSAATAIDLRGMGPTTDNITIINNTNNIHIVKGTGEENRIGNKVNLKGINMVLGLSFVTDAIATYLSHSESCKMVFNFRIMTVKFDQQMSRTDIARWYQETFIYYRLINLSGGDKFPKQSNWMDKKRDSTKWTGSFSILKDKKFTLDKEHSFTQFNYNLGFNKDVNFDNTSNNPTENQYISNIYTFLIAPSNNFYDMDAVSQSKVENFATASQAIWGLEGNIKYIYYDM